MSTTLFRQLLPLAPMVCASAHIVEEFIFPGGFIPWYRRYRPNYAQSITPAHLFLINGFLIALTAIVAYEGLSWREGPALWLTLTTVLGANGLWHIVGTLKMKNYSPGIITGVLLYLPLLAVGTVYLIDTDLIGTGSAVVDIVIGASYQIWSDALHRRRSR